MQSVFTGPVYHVVRDNITNTESNHPQPNISISFPPSKTNTSSSARKVRPVRFARIALRDALLSGRPAWTANIRSSSGDAISAAAVRANTRRSRWVPADLQTCPRRKFRPHLFRNCVATGELYPCECRDRLFVIFSRPAMLWPSISMPRPSPSKPPARCIPSSP